MTQLERFCSLLDEMNVRYEVEENDHNVFVFIHSGEAEYANSSDSGAADVVFDKQGNRCISWS